MKLSIVRLGVLLAMLAGPASAQQAPPDMITLRFESWKQPVHISRLEANSVIHTAFVAHGFGGWIPLETGPEFAAFRGDSTGLSPPDPDADMISMDLSQAVNGVQVARLRLARMRPAPDGGFEVDADFSDSPEAKAIFADIEAGLLRAR